MVIAKKGVGVSRPLLIAYIVVSALFILMSMVSYLKNSVYNVGVQAGVTSAINGVMQKAVDPKCEAFTLFSGQTQVGLVNIKCLQQQAPAQEGAPVQNQVEPTTEPVAQ